MKLNLGCGFKKIPGFINVDKEARCEPDHVVDLEKFPWPWADNSITEVMAIHTLEHLGATPAIWIGVLKELWRVCTPDAQIHLAVPHPRHDNFLHDPTHVRAITPIGLAMFDQKRNLENIEIGDEESKLGLYSNIDLEVQQISYDLEEPYRTQYLTGKLNTEDLEFMIKEKNNFCHQIRMLVRIVKPCRSHSNTII